MSALDDKYEIEAEVGHGPSACVFQATEKDSSRSVALKHLDANDDRAKQFPYESEWDKIVALTHPSVVKAIEHIEEDGERYIISEFVKSETLEKHIQRDGALPELQCVQIFRALALALNDAHANGLLHLNIRPGNVFLSQTQSGMFGRIGDFGCWTMGIDPGPNAAKMAFYKSPEQRKGTGIMVASDVYSLGKLLYVALSGVDDGRITPTALPEDCALQEVIYSCIRTRMEDRLQSMDEFVAALDRVEAEQLSNVEVGASVAAGDQPAFATPTSEVSVTGQMRADSEVQSMIIACRSHLTNKKLKSCRKVVGTARDGILEYAPALGAEWVEKVTTEVDEIEQQLTLKEQELEQMVRSAEQAHAEARYEDVEMLAAAANEVCKEHPGCERIAEEARKAMTNIRTFMEDAFTSMKVKDYKRADVDCIKILEISPNNVDALNMRKKIKSVMFRRRMIGLTLKIVPIFLIVGVGGGGYLFLKHQTDSAKAAFTKAVSEKRGNAAEAEANKLQGRPEWVRKIFGEFKPAQDFLKESASARKALDEATEAQKRATADPTASIQLDLKQTESALKQAKAEFDACNFDAALKEAEEASADFDRLYLKSVLQKVDKLYAAEKYEEAFNILETAAASISSSDLDAKIRKVKAKLAPELLVETYVNGKQVKGAKVAVRINGKVADAGTTPKAFLLDVEVGQEFDVLVVLPPENGLYSRPVKKMFAFDSREAKSLRIDLETIPGPQKSKDWSISDLDLTLKGVPGGRFIMGSEMGEIHERPPYPVHVTRHIWMGQYEVTKYQFNKVLGLETNESDKRVPVANVSRTDAEKFCRALNRMENKKNLIPNNYEYRLPTEAEWEFCCRAGEEKNPTSITSLGWYAGNSDNEVKKVGGKQSNAWGLYDMLGNVSEWCLDSFNSGVYSKRKEMTISKDPVHISGSSSFASVRGGSYASPLAMCMPSARDKKNKTLKDARIGFRVILGPKRKILNQD